MNTSDVRIIDLLLDSFLTVPDPRIHRRRVYPLPMLLLCALITVLYGQTSFHAMNAVAIRHKDLLVRLFDVEDSPSHDTFNRLFSILDKKLFALCLQRFSEKIGDIMSRHVVAIDGKTCRRARSAAIKAAHIISVWSKGEKLSLAVAKVDDKTNEIPEVPKLIDLLGKTLKGTVVTADAMNTQKETAQAALRNGADYVLPVKDNHPALNASVMLYLDHLAETTKPGWHAVEKGHGRLEERKCWQTEDIGDIAELHDWPGIRSIFVIERTSQYLANGKPATTGRRYYLSSLPLDPEEAARCARDHWDIENSCHWSLDVVFDEDYSRARAGNLAANLRTLRSLAMNVLSRVKKILSLTESRPLMMLNACMDPQYLYRLLEAIPNQN